jgi:hypothetical protein
VDRLSRSCVPYRPFPLQIGGLDQNNTFTVSWKAAGLGNTTDTVDFTLTGTINVTSQCFTRSGNPVNGVPKSETNNVNQSDTFDVRNGQTTGSFTVSPRPRSHALEANGFASWTSRSTCS